MLRRAYWALARNLGKRKVSANPREIFSEVYAKRVWGVHSDEEFCSGDGSRDERVVGPYVRAVSDYLQTLGSPPRVVDIGCGDFRVGSRIVPFASHYIACDVVAKLIERNRSVYTDPKLTFRALDAVSDPLPDGDVVCIRQVLQHLSNDHIAAILSKLRQFRYWIVTEHLPEEADFIPNRDKPTGGDIRIRHLRSGVVLTKPPFAIEPRKEQLLCEVSIMSGDRRAVIRTIAYSF
jgi:SAM-dependent methyltransferase